MTLLIITAGSLAALFGARIAYKWYMDRSFAKIVANVEKNDLRSPPADR